MRPSVPRRYWWTYQRHRGNVGTTVLIHPAGHPRKGRPSPKLAATDPNHQRAHQPHNWSSRRYFYNLEFGGHVPEVSSTSRPVASRRSVPRVVFRLVGRLWYRRCYHSTVSLGMLSAVRCPCPSRRALEPNRAECSSLAPAGVTPHPSPLFQPDKLRLLQSDTW